MSINAGTAMGYLDLNTSKFKKGISSALKDLEEFKKSTATTSSKMNAIGSAFSALGSSLTKGVTTPITAVGTGLAKMALDFESSFSKVSTLLDSNVVDFDKYKTSILAASSESKVAVEDFSEAVYQSISAGVDQTKAIGFTTEAMKLARGGFTSGANAVDLLTTAINAYGLSAEDVTKVSDQLITTQNLGKTTVDELASSLGRVIPTANSVGIDLTNVNTAMAILTKNGIATAEATTYLNSMLNELGTSGSKADEALKELSGKGFRQLIAEGVPLTDVLEMLKQEAENSGKSLNDMFGSSEAAKAALTIMKDSGAEYNEILIKMADSAGATQAAVEKIDASPLEVLNSSINELKNSLISVGEYLIPFVTQTADHITKLANSFMGLSDETKESIVKIAAAIASIGPVMLILGKVIKVIAAVVKAFGTVKTAIAIYTGAASEGSIAAVTLAKAFTGISSVVGTVTSAISGVGAAIVGTLGAPVTIAIGIVAALAAGFIYLWNTCDSFREFWINLWDSIVEVLSNLGQTVISFFTETIPAAFESFLNALQGIGESIVQFFTVSIPTAFNNFVTVIIPNFINGVITFFQQLPYNIGYIIGQIIGYIYVWGADMISWVATTIPEVINNIVTFFSELPSKIWEWLVNVINNIVTWGSQMLSQAISIASNFLTNVITYIQQLPGKIASFLSSVISNVISWGSQMISSAISTASNFVSNFIQFIRELPSKVKGIIEQIPGVVKSIGSKLYSAGKEIFNNLWDGIKSIGESILGWVSDFAGKIGSFVSGIVDGFKDVVSGADKAKQAAKSVDGSHANGLNYVPFNGYIAELHEGERVLTKEENRRYSNKSGSQNTSSGDTFNFYNTQPNPYEYARQMKQAKKDLALGI